ncbi:MAG: DUF1007 family protein [Alphaproteobacteria bacterium]
MSWPMALARRLPGMALVLLFMAAGVGASPAAAHPHAWIDLRSTVILDETGSIVALEEEWLFDEFYTLFAMDSLPPSGDSMDKRLTDLARLNLESLQPYGYFTEVRADDAKVALGTVEEFETALRNGRIWLRFVLPLGRSIDPRKEQMSFAVFDPSYYIEILHLKDDVIAFRGKEVDGCAGRIIPPTPTDEAIMMAAALDRNAASDDTLGAIFAETVKVTC